MKIEYLFRSPFHYVAGVLTVLSAFISPALVIAGVLLFIFYELNQDWHIKDSAYHDLREFMVAFFIAVIGVLIWQMF